MNLKELYESITGGYEVVKKLKTEFNPDGLDCLFNPKPAREPGLSVMDCEDIVARLTSADAAKVVRATRCEKQGLIFAMIAPAFLGQFPGVTSGQLRSALKSVGFDGMVEVALFADILTLKEAFEFDKNIRNESDFQLTSCCCPMWIGMIRKLYSTLMPHIPPSVSPMAACGRIIKKLHSGAVTVFVGPCIAKKAEAKEADIAPDVDYVLTFLEAAEIFNSLGIEPAMLPIQDKDHSSRLGRIYAYSGGVSEAVASTVHKIFPNRRIQIRTRAVDGVQACRQMMNGLSEGKQKANFFEGMGCVGGCVGGPRAVMPAAAGRIHVEQYGNAAYYDTPIDNPYVIELLHRLGIDTSEQLLHSPLFSRDF